MKISKNFLSYQLPAIVWAIAIFIQSSMSYLNTPDLGFSFQDKFAHFIEYGILGFLLFRAISYFRNRGYTKKSAVLTFIIGSLYAISDEIHQYFVPGRSADIEDVFADMLGILTVVIVSKIIIDLKMKQRIPEELNS